MTYVKKKPTHNSTKKNPPNKQTWKRGVQSHGIPSVHSIIFASSWKKKKVQSDAFYVCCIKEIRIWSQCWVYKCLCRNCYWHVSWKLHYYLEEKLSELMYKRMEVFHGTVNLKLSVWLVTLTLGKKKKEEIISFSTFNRSKLKLLKPPDLSPIFSLAPVGFSLGTFGVIRFQWKNLELVSIFGLPPFTDTDHVVSCIFSGFVPLL